MYFPFTALERNFIAIFYDIVLQNPLKEKIFNVYILFPLVSMKSFSPTASKVRWTLPEAK